MDPSDIPRAVTAGLTTASDLGLSADDATVLHASNRIAVRLLPTDVLVRVAHEAHTLGAAFEVEVARRLTASGAPVAGVDPRVERLTCALERRFNWRGVRLEGQPR
jgi:hypothetical protein